MLKIRVDDVFQLHNYSSNQLKAFEIKSPFDWFLEATDRWRDYPLVLAVVAEGVSEQSGLVDYIKSTPKWTVQSHGWEHKIHKHYPYNILLELLKRSKDEIERVFGQEVTEFYPPKMLYNENTEKASLEAGMVEVRERFTAGYWLKDRSIPAIYFHYWNQGNLQQMEKIWRALQEN